MQHSDDRNDPDQLAVTRTSVGSDSDDPRITEAMEVYLRELEAGRIPDRDEFLARYPEIADQLEGQLVGLDFLHGVAPQVTGEETKSQTFGDDRLSPRATLGDFQLIRQIGQGGMGVVYEAEQLSLGRRVAVKVSPFAAMLNEQHRKRFQNEARAAATLDHPNIVPVHFVGQERGVHFFAMHLIEGQSLAELIEGLRDKQSEPTALAAGNGTENSEHGPRLAPSAHKIETIGDFHSAVSTQRSSDPDAFFQTAARLGAEAAEALEHSHQLGILHRDIKPGNLLIDTTGKLWVADFGLATIEHGETLTRTGGVVGTVAYMSPEQATDSHNIDGRSDVYSLGATLYELLALRRHRSDDRLSAMLNLQAEPGSDSPTRIGATVPDDLETIVIKALAEDPTDRYQSAGVMAEDLRSFIDGGEIQARRLTFAQRQARWLRRHRRVATAVVVASFLLLTAFGTVMAVNSSRLASSEQKLRTALLDSNQSRVEAEQQTLLAERRLKRAEQSEQEARNSELVARKMNYRRDLQRAFASFADRNVATSVKLLQPLEPDSDSTDLRGIEWRILSAETKALRHSLGSHDGPATECVLYPDGKTVATAGEDGEVHLWDVVLRKRIKTLRPRIGPIHAMAISPDGERLAVAGKPRLETLGSAVVYLLDSRTGERQGMVQRHQRTIESIAWSPDGNLIAAGSRYDYVKLSTLAGKSLPSIKTDTRNEAIVFSPDSKQVATSWAGNHGIRVWDCATGELVVDSISFQPSIASIAWSPDGGFLIAARKGGVDVKAIDFETGEALASLTIGEPRPKELAVIAISADGNTIAGGDSEGRIHQWQVDQKHWRRGFRPGSRHESIKPSIDPLAVDEEAVTGLAMLADGAVVTTHHSGRVKLTNPQRSVARVHTLDVDVTAAAALDERSIYLGTGKGEIGRFDFDSGKVELIADLCNCPIADLATSRDTPQVAVVYRTGYIDLVDGRDGTILWTQPRKSESDHPIDRIAVSLDARYVALSGDDRQITFWDVQENRQVMSRQSPAAGEAIAISTDGKWIAQGADGTELLAFPSGRLARRFDDSAVRSIQFSPDGRYLVRGTADGSIRLKDLTTESENYLRGHASGVRSIAFSDDGQTLLTIDSENLQKIRFWDVATGELYGTLDNPIGSENLSHDSRIKIFLIGGRVILCGLNFQNSKIAVWDLGQ